MSLEDRKLALRKEIERKARYLESLENMPDFGELAEGTVMGLLISYAGSRPYPLIAYRGGESWYLTGERSPNKISSDDLAEWVVSQGRALRLAVVLGEFGVEAVPMVDLGSLLGGLLGDRR
jgi:hypothetical protein